MINILLPAWKLHLHKRCGCLKSLADEIRPIICNSAIPQNHIILLNNILTGVLSLSINELKYITIK